MWQDGKVGRLKKAKNSTVPIFLTSLQTRGYVSVALCYESTLLLLMGHFEYNSAFAEKDSIK